MEETNESGYEANTHQLSKVLAEWHTSGCSSLTESEGEDVPIWRGILKSSSSICRSSSFISRPGAPLQGEEDTWKGSEYSSVIHAHTHTRTTTVNHNSEASCLPPLPLHTLTLTHAHTHTHAPPQ